MSLSFGFSTNILALKRTHNVIGKQSVESKPLPYTSFPSCLIDSFDKAVSKGYVKDFGRIVQLDDKGCFPAQNGLHLPEENVSMMTPVIEAILDAAQRGNMPVRSIFVRGSFASGNMFQDGRSDLDLLIISDRKPSQLTSQRIYSAAYAVCRSALNLSGLDIRYVETIRGYPLRNSLDASPSITVLLQAYSVLLYGAGTESFGIHAENVKPSDDIAVNIRCDQRSFLRVFHSASGTFDTQLAALQWICKRGLRAATDLCSGETKTHSRDMVPCYRITSTAKPQYKSVFLSALLVTCANTTNELMGASRPEFLSKGLQIAFNLIEVVEELSLKESFGAYENDKLQTYFAPTQVPPQTLSLTTISKSIQSVLSNIVQPSKHTYTSQTQFRSSPLPEIEVRPTRSVEEGDPLPVSESTFSQTGLTPYLTKVSKPRVFRRVLQGHYSDACNQERIINAILNTQDSVQCRVSPSPEVTFCRSDHPWISSKLFSPPSVMKTLSPTEALERMRADCSLPPLQYARDDEVVYIQSELEDKLCVFLASKQDEIQVAQSERIWISTNGMVSGLHYDAAHSALLQQKGSKRMILFPKECLSYLGIYPLGHPLHRRSRVNLGNRHSAVFKEFWRCAAAEAVEVRVDEGDLVVFPPFWTHYTESITGSNRELSISHTFRYV